MGFLGEWSVIHLFFVGKTFDPSHIGPDNHGSLRPLPPAVQGPLCSAGRIRHRCVSTGVGLLG